MNMIASATRSETEEPQWERITVEVCTTCGNRTLNVDQKHRPDDRLKYTVRRECFSKNCEDAQYSDYGGGFL